MPAGTLVRLSPTITHGLQRVRLRPWRHAEPQYLAQGPHVVGRIFLPVFSGISLKIKMLAAFEGLYVGM
jgi:hypothetical protein